MMKTITKKITIDAPPEKVFDRLDDLGIAGMHMTQSSVMMMGSKLNLQYLTDHQRGAGSKYRWTGKMMGMDMDFTVEVKKWIRGIEKTWETTGKAKMIIYDWYQMHLLVSGKGDRSVAELSITYTRPKSLLGKVLSYLFANWYCHWCLGNMLNDTKRSLEPNYNSKSSFMKLKAFKFGIALGLAFSLGFLFCNLILLVGGSDFSLTVMNILFHDYDFQPLMTSNGLNFGKLLAGMAGLFIIGGFLGWLTAWVYNVLNRTIRT